MSSSAQPVTSLSSLRTRSMGSKFFIILFLAFAMSISGFFVERLTTERADVHGFGSATAEPASQQATTILGVRLADSYRSIHRSLHYITLFLGLVFLTYFLLEILTGKSVHPAQYALVGVAQTIFYLLLLSLAEHLGFDLSFLIAGTFTVALLSVNAEWIFRSRKFTVRACAIFILLYTFIYVLLRIEAYALLVGAFSSFAAVAAAMYITRNIEWYGAATLRPTFTDAAHPGRVERESWLK
jgi:inner membrane protein involved in colicin E2 resistance